MENRDYILSYHINTPIHDDGVVKMCYKSLIFGNSTDLVEHLFNESILYFTLSIQYYNINIPKIDYTNSQILILIYYGCKEFKKCELLDNWFEQISNIYGEYEK